MKDYVEIGASPSDEECAQIGEDNYYSKAKEECTRYIALLRKQFGKEPQGAKLAIKSFAHDFGSYMEVVCYFDKAFPDSVEYAFRCEGEAPETWKG